MRQVNARGGASRDDRPESCTTMGKMAMKVMLLLTAGGPLVILTGHESVTEPGLLKTLKAKGIEKFVAYEIPLALAQARYGGHFFVVEHDLRETEDMRVLDENGPRAFALFRFSELGPPITYEPADRASAEAADGPS